MEYSIKEINLQQTYFDDHLRMTKLTKAFKPKFGEFNKHSSFLPIHVSSKDLEKNQILDLDVEAILDHYLNYIRQKFTDGSINLLIADDFMMSKGDVFLQNEVTEYCFLKEEVLWFATKKNSSKDFDRLINLPEGLVHSLIVGTKIDSAKLPSRGDQLDDALDDIAEGANFLMLSVAHNEAIALLEKG